MHKKAHAQASWAGVALLLVACSTLLAAGQADAQSRSALKRRLGRIAGEKAEVRSRLRDTKAEQLTARNELCVAQRDVAEAERQLKAAQWQLGRTRGTIRRVKDELTNTEATLNRHKQELGQRILVTYKAGIPSYLEVLLNATDFGDFVNRAEFNARIASEDAALLQAMTEYQHRREQQRVQLRQKEAEQVSLRRQVQARRDEVVRKKRHAEALVEKANEDRVTYERQLAEMEAAEKAVEELLARLPSGTGLYGTYKGKWAGTFIWPMRGRITSPFGMRLHPILGYRKMHKGIDIAFAGCGGAPIKAAADGRVVHAGWRGALGVSAIIDHGSGMGTVYGHFQSGSLRVVTGQNVTRGQVLGRCGTTGRSTGNHLHFGVLRNGRCVDPLDYL